MLFVYGSVKSYYFKDNYPKSNLEEVPFIIPLHKYSTAHSQRLCPFKVIRDLIS